LITPPLPFEQPSPSLKLHLSVLQVFLFLPYHFQWQATKHNKECKKS
jgi:hypothetical protein